MSKLPPDLSSRLIAEVHFRVANPEGISITVRPDRLREAATDLLHLRRKLGPVLHAEVRGDGLVEVVFRDEGPLP